MNQNSNIYPIRKCNKIFKFHLRIQAYTLITSRDQLHSHRCFKNRNHRLKPLLSWTFNLFNYMKLRNNNKNLNKLQRRSKLIRQKITMLKLLSLKLKVENHNLWSNQYPEKENQKEQNKKHANAWFSEQPIIWNSLL